MRLRPRPYWVGIWASLMVTAMAESYDYIIVGGGTAGLTVAARLSEDPQVTVLVLEAGADRSADLNVLAPGLFPAMYGDADYDWDYKTIPQTSANNKVVAHIRGKQLGGSSAMNFMFWTHPSRRDIDNWGALGNEGWSWEALAPYFRKSESFVAPSSQQTSDLLLEYVDPSVHGATGPIINEFPQLYSPFLKAWPRTFEKLGLEVDGDPRDGLALGGYVNLLNIDKSTRSYAANAYLDPARHRTNLKVVTDALVTKLVLKKTRNGIQVEGVKWSQGGETHEAAAKMEVVLAAGSVASPQLLEVSGVGDKKLLGTHGVEVFVDNPNVGENLQDHVYVPLGFAAKPGVPTNEDYANATYFQEQLDLYLQNKTGRLSSAGASSALLSLNQIASTLDLSLPSQKNSVPSLAEQHGIIFRDLKSEAIAQELTIEGGISPQFSADTTKLFSAGAPGNFLSLLGVLEHPSSRGAIHIRSADAAVHPLIDPRYLSHPLDVQLLKAIALHLQTVARTPPLSNLLQGGGTVFQPGYHELTAENVEDWIRDSMQSEYHPCGTCAMLPRSKGGVIDERFKVYGVKGLRVVDASIFPLIPRANIQSLVYAVAERAADFIKEDAL
ncbi:GMC oxidoreductase [Colletotrichum orchidophilum]|uniref:GMC oxidoreductase n=1 Tax=Colletotrichum orchidophilum TaxID=1209926 RepID=A0A1G4BDH1_9PEZI|nr:GMC oxidoreductase [Colletotrichum orchidophilum]OHE99413.1 GMC oxidoreductase [Colletotrichum orchidophilum]